MANIQPPYTPPGLPSPSSYPIFGGKPPVLSPPVSASSAQDEYANLQQAGWRNFVFPCMSFSQTTLTQSLGSIAWCEAYTRARLFNAILGFGRMLVSQLEPVDATIYLQRWQNILLCFLPQDQLDMYLQQLQLQTNTPPTVNNINTFLTEQLGQIYLG